MTNKPILYSSNQILYQNGIRVGYRFHKEPDLSVARHISDNNLSGCTFVFNRVLADEILNKSKPPADVIDYRLHDTWVYMVAAIRGNIIYDSESGILYRIHENNVVGIRKITWFVRLKRFLHIGAANKNRGNLRMKTAAALLERYDCNNDSDKTILLRYANYQKSFKDKLLLMNDQSIIEATNENKYIFKIKVLLNLV